MHLNSVPPNSILAHNFFISFHRHRNLLFNAYILQHPPSLQSAIFFLSETISDPLLLGSYAPNWIAFIPQMNKTSLGKVRSNCSERSDAVYFHKFKTVLIIRGLMLIHFDPYAP